MDVEYMWITSTISDVPVYYIWLLGILWNNDLNHVSNVKNDLLTLWRYRAGITDGPLRSSLATGQRGSTGALLGGSRWQPGHGLVPFTKQ